MKCWWRIIGLLALLRLVALVTTCTVSVAAATEVEETATGSEDPFLNWYNQRTDDYPFSVSLTSTGVESLTLHWRIDQDNEIIHLALVYENSSTLDNPLNAREASSALGWMAFGIGEAGGMPGADMVVIEGLDSDEPILTDRYATDYVTPLVDPTGPSDWQLDNVHQWWATDVTTSPSLTTSFATIVQVSRALDTGDAHYDRPIRFDGTWDLPPHRILVAWGASQEMVYHGSSQRYSTSVRFFPSAQIQPGNEAANFERKMETAEFFEVRMANYGVPSGPTTYTSRCVSWDDFLDQQSRNSQEEQFQEDTPFHIVGFEPVIETQFPHHMVLYGSPATECSKVTSWNKVSLHGWAIGEGPQVLPDAVGLPLGGTEGYKTFVLSMHFDNRNRIQGGRDSSGFRIYYTPQLRPETLTLLLLADPLIALIGESIVPQTSPTGLSRHAFSCPSSCTETMLTTSPSANTKSSVTLDLPHPITVVKELLHMHEQGISMTNRILRNGLLVHEGTIEYWDNHMSGLYPTRANYTIYPGDVLETTCNYRANPSSNTKFGTGSLDEMCIAFLYYYPPLPETTRMFDMCGKDTDTDSQDPCFSDYEECDWPNLEAVGRIFGQDPDAEEGTVSDGLIETDPNLCAVLPRPNPIALDTDVDVPFVPQVEDADAYSSSSYKSYLPYLMAAWMLTTTTSLVIFLG